MADDREDRAWVVGPPGPGEVVIHLVGGDDVEITDEQEAAIAALIESFEADAEVVGHGSSCDGFTCGKVACTGLECKGLTIKIAGAPSITGTIISRPIV